MKQKIILIISGYNYRGIIAFLRFCKQNNIKAYILASGDNDLLYLTDYKNQIICSRKSDQLSYSELVSCKKIITGEMQDHEIIIYPSTEYLNRFILKERSALESEGFIIPLPHQDTYSQISDKSNFIEICKKYQIKTPEEYDQVDESVIPFVAKPKKYFLNCLKVNQKPLLVKSRQDFEYLKNISNNADFFYQRYIEGQSFYLLYYFMIDGHYSLFSQKNLMQQANGLSIIAAKSSDLHTNPVSAKFTKLFLDVKFRGFVMVEIRAFENEFYMIEANPRPWGPSQLISDSGMDLFHAFARDFDLIPNRSVEWPEYKSDVNYFWSGGIFEDQIKKNKIAFHHYSPDQFFCEYLSWIESDIYLRTDTINIFQKELKEKKRA